MASKAGRKPSATQPKARRNGGARGAGMMIGAAAVGVIAGVAANLGRKAMVQAPSALAGDWMEALKAEHKATLLLFDALQATTDAQHLRRAMLLTQLKHALGKHAFAEENVIYPEIRDAGEAPDADALNKEHGYVKQYLYELDKMDNTSPRFLEKVAAFRADIESHVREEEDRLFPALHAKLGDRNSEVTLAMNKEAFKLA